MLGRYGRCLGRRNSTFRMFRSTFSSGCPFFSYMARKKKGIMTTIIPMAAVLTSQNCFSKKKDGTPMSAADPKQISCRFVRLNITLLLTFVRSLGTDTYDAAIVISFPFRELFVLVSPRQFPV